MTEHTKRRLMTGAIDGPYYTRRGRHAADRAMVAACWVALVVFLLWFVWGNP